MDMEAVDLGHEMYMKYGVQIHCTLGWALEHAVNVDFRAPCRVAGRHSSFNYGSMNYYGVQVLVSSACALQGGQKVGEDIHTWSLSTCRQLMDGTA